MPKANKQSFEKALRRLEEIVQELENGEIPLDDSLKIYEEGVELTKFCYDKLNQTEEKLKKLVKKNNGDFDVENFEQN
jgi:exodeoxyribonuclease VII small subunit